MDFFIYVTDILSVQFTLNQPQPVIFIKVTPGCGGRLRSHLKMSLKSPEFFDPGSTGEASTVSCWFDVTRFFDNLLYVFSV